MKKNSFVEGTFIATLAIVITKIMGIIYVIPFYSTIGARGSALYSYAYNVYLIFLSISSAGIPIAMSKIISEYDSQGLVEAKVRSFKIGLIIIGILSLVSFLVLIFFPQAIAHIIIGDLSGGNTIKDVALVILTVSFSILVVPFLSITKGYLQGHKYIKPTSISQIIEQFIRILIIIFGSYLVIKVFKRSVTLGVMVAILGSFFGGIVASLYLLRVINKNKQKLSLNKKLSKDKISNKAIFKKIISYAIPFVIINLTVNIYNVVDMSLILRTLTNLKFSGAEAEFVASAIATWGYKLNEIVAAIATGLTISLIPNLVAVFTVKNYVKTNDIINKALQIILFISIPAALGLSFLAKPVWTLFYGASNLGPIVFKVSILITILSNIYIILIQAGQSMSMYKTVYSAVFLGFLTNLLLDIPLMYLCYYIKIPAFWGASFASIMGYILAISIVLKSFKKIKEINYKETVNVLGKIILSVIIMFSILKLLNLILPFSNLNRIKALILVIIYAVVGLVIYLTCTYKLQIITKLFGNSILKKINKPKKIK